MVPSLPENDAYRRGPEGTLCRQRKYHTDEGEAHENLMNEFNVKSFPTWILYKDGQEVWRDSGEKPALELEDMIDRFV